ncbi:MAG: SAM-dependent DNA methyltransferase [Acidobacteria bacterium]|nr:SAM-dependent DNA methyltransferase [Acidobacteriota bacterium]
MSVQLTQDFASQTKALIDNLKTICASAGLGNDGNEFKIITQTFLYKFMNDKFGYEIKERHPELKTAESWEKHLESLPAEQYTLWLKALPAESARLRPEHLISSLFNRTNEPEFAKLFDDTLRDISILNANVFSIKTDSGQKDKLFDELSNFITDSSKRDDFCRALVNQLVNFSFERIFAQKFDFFAEIFEYLIKDYNKDGGGKYAEYYTPHAVARIIAAILIPEPVSDVTCFDPAAGSGRLLMDLAHAIGEEKCTLYSQDISQKSTSMLRLNLILNNLVHSMNNVVRGDVLTSPYHKNGDKLDTFDYIVSNPPFKLDFSNIHDQLDVKENHGRFFAGIPNVPAKKKESMAIYLLFIQHIIYTLKANGKAAVVVPTGFLTAQSGIEKKIRTKLVDEKMLRGVVSMPSNIFATTGTNVSVLFIDKANKKGDIVLMDASKLGTTVKEGKNQKTLLSHDEEQKIIDTFNRHEAVEDFTVVVGYDEIKAKNYSFSAGQYFDIKIEYTDITAEEFDAKMNEYKSILASMFGESKVLENEIQRQLSQLTYG